MRTEQFSFLEISQDPLLTILAVVLIGTVWLILPTGSKTRREPEAQSKESALQAEVQSLEDKLRVLDAELQSLADEKKRLETLLAGTPGAPAGAPPSRLSSNLIDQLKKEIDGRQRELAALEEKLKEARPKASALKAQNQRLLDEIAALDRQILAAQQDQDKIRKKLDETKREIAQAQNEKKAKEDELEKLRKKAEKPEGQAPVRGTIVVRSKKSKTVDVQLVNNRLLPVDDEHFEVTSSGYIERGGQTYAAQVRSPRKGKGDNLDTVGLPQSKLSALLKKINKADTRVMIYVDRESQAMLEKALMVIKSRDPEIEVGWWPDDDVTFTRSAAPSGSENRPPSLKETPR